MKVNKCMYFIHINVLIYIFCFYYLLWSFGGKACWPCDVQNEYFVLYLVKLHSYQQVLIP